MLLMSANWILSVISVLSVVEIYFMGLEFGDDDKVGMHPIS